MHWLGGSSLPDRDIAAPNRRGDSAMLHWFNFGFKKLEGYPTVLISDMWRINEVTFRLQTACMASCGPVWASGNLKG